MANYYRYQLRGAKEEDWDEANPVLTKNEPGYDQTNNRLKFGDGPTPWNELPYLAPDVVDDLLSLSTTSALNRSEVVNNLTSTSTTSALSAAQGKNLNDIKLNKGDVVNNLTNTNIAAALSTAQGKFLNDTKLNKSDVIDNLTSTSTTSALSAAQGKVLKELIDNVV